jgi:hypothetical protein
MMNFVRGDVGDGREARGAWRGRMWRGGKGRGRRRRGSRGGAVGQTSGQGMGGEKLGAGGFVRWNGEGELMRRSRQKERVPDGRGTETDVARGLERWEGEAASG